MKKAILILLCIALPLIVLSCLERKNYVINRQGQMEKPLELKLKDDNANMFTLVYDYQVNNIDVVRRERAKLMGIKVKRITCQVVSYSGEEGATIDAQVKAGEQSNTDTKVISAFRNLNLLEMAKAGNEVTIPLAPDAASYIDEVLNADKQLTLAVVGEADKPVQCRLKLKVYMDVKFGS